MNPPDLKPSMNPNPNPNFYHPERGFTAGTGEPGNWKPPINPMTLVSWLSRPTIPTRNRNTRPLWSSMMSTRRTIPLDNPGSGHPDYPVQLDASDAFGLCNYGYGEPSDSGSRWSSLVSPSNPITVVLATGYNEALEASVLNEFYWLRPSCRSPYPCAAGGAESLLNPRRLSLWLSQN